MRVFVRLFMFIASLLLSLVAAPSPVDPSGHWEGLVQVPDRPVAVAVELWTMPSGQLAGTFAQPDQGIKALPLSAVTVQARDVRFIVKGGVDGVFEGELKEPAGEIAGTWRQTGASLPLTLVRAKR